ncbi:MAG: hypothetical protein HKO66_09700 [Saprospiraceae bacterium]|nr:hypothetical protein [Saprospiraceae bacterium]
MGSKKKRKEEKRKLKKALAQKQLVKKEKEKDRGKNLLTILVILVFTFAAFSPSLNNGYVNWDDDKNFAENEHITTLTKDNFWKNTKLIFTTDVIGGYNPLTIWTFLLEHKIFGLDKPFYWHLNNILLHLVCTFFVFWIGLRLGLGYLGAVFLALLFGVHPMRVESVAWVTERKDVLYGSFYLAALFYYIKGKQDGFKKKYIAIIAICFILSLFSKIQAVILPISMILVDYYLSKEKIFKIKQILTKATYLLASFAFGVYGILMLKDEGSTEQVYSGISRIFIGAYTLIVYYVKAIIPYELSPLYPYPSSLDWRFPVSSISFIITGGLLFYAYKKKKHVLFFGLGFFIANVILLLQIFGAGQGFLADRFTYISYIGLFFLMAFGIEHIIKKKASLKPIVLGLSGLVIFIYSYMTFQQNKIWKDSGTLWTHVLKYYDHSTLPWGNRANFYRDNGMTAQALHDYSQVIRLNPKASEPYNSRARLYFNFSQRDSLLKALFNYNKAIELKQDVEYIVNRGATYAKLGDLNKALENLNQAEQIDPTFSNIYLNKSVIYNNLNDPQNALVNINKYINLKQYNADMWYEKGRLHYILGQPQEGLKACNRAISIRQDKGVYYFERAKINYSLKNIAQAKADMQNSARLGYQGDANIRNTILNSN